jgi:hypothetical protein
MGRYLRLLQPIAIPFSPRPRKSFDDFPGEDFPQQAIATIG